MATTHRHPPVRIAEQVIESNPFTGDPDELEEHIRSLIMLGIAAYNDASNQRPENLSEACGRLGINLHWKPRNHIPALNRSDRPTQRDRYAIFFGHGTPLSTHSHEEPCILEIENLREQYPEVSLWVEAVL